MTTLALMLTLTDPHDASEKNWTQLWFEPDKLKREEYHVNSLEIRVCR